MQALAEFLRKQEEAYASFVLAGEKVRREGIVRDPALEGKMCGFFVNLAHPPYVAARASQFSKRVSAITGSSPYEESDVHSTIASQRIPALSIINPADPEYRATLDGIVAAVRGAVSWTLRGRRPAIRYDRPYLYTDVVAIAPGEPNDAFLELAEGIVEAAQAMGVELRLPWGAALTLARFVRPIRAEELGEFFRLMEDAPLPGESVLVSVNVYYNTYPGPWNDHGVTQYASIPL